MSQAVEQDISPAAVGMARGGAPKGSTIARMPHMRIISMPGSRGNRALVVPKNTTAPAVAGALFVAELVQSELHPRQPRGIHEAIILVGVGIHDW